MKKQYKKSSLNITSTDEKFQLGLLTHQQEYFVDVKLLKQTKEEVILEYKMNDEYKKLSEVKERYYQERLRLMLNIVKMLEVENEFIQGELTNNNIIYTPSLHPKFVERKLKVNVENTEDEKLYVMKRILGYMFLDAELDQLLKADEKILYKNKLVKRIIANCETIEDFKKSIYDVLQEYEENMENEKIVKRTHIKKLENFRSRNKFVYLILLTLLIYLFFIKIPFLKNQIEIVEYYEQQQYSEVIDVLDGMSLRNMSKTVKYYATVSVVQSENLNDVQKDNILENLTVNTEENVLDYWILIGQQEYEDAYNKAVTLGKLDLQEYAVMKQLELIEADEKMDLEDRQAAIAELEGQIKEIEAEKEAAQAEEE